MNVDVPSFDVADTIVSRTDDASSESSAHSAVVEHAMLELQRKKGLCTSSLLDLFPDVHPLVLKSVSESCRGEQIYASETILQMTRSSVGTGCVLGMVQMFTNPNITNDDLRFVQNLLLMHRLWPSVYHHDHFERLGQACILSQSRREALFRVVDDFRKEIEECSTVVEASRYKRHRHSIAYPRGGWCDPVTQRRMTFSTTRVADLPSSTKGLRPQDFKILNICFSKPSVFNVVLDGSTAERVMHATLQLNFGLNGSNWVVADCVTRGNFIFMFPEALPDSCCAHMIYLKDSDVVELCDQSRGEYILMVTSIVPDKLFDELSPCHEQLPLFLSFSSQCQFAAWKAHILHVSRGFGHPTRDRPTTTQIASHHLHISSRSPFETEIDVVPSWPALVPTPAARNRVAALRQSPKLFDRPPSPYPRVPPVFESSAHCERRATRRGRSALVDSASQPTLELSSPIHDMFIETGDGDEKQEAQSLPVLSFEHQHIPSD